MAKADVLALIDDLAGDRSDTDPLADATAVDSYYRDAVFDMGMTKDIITDAAFVAVSAGTAEYAQPTAAIRPLMLCYDDFQLRPSDRRAVEAYNPLWRTRKGTPHSYLTVDESWRTWRLVPVPDSTGETVGALTPFDITFPGGNLTFIYTANVDDVPAVDEAWLAFDVLSREFSRESDHTDLTFSKVGAQLASVFRQLVGYEEIPNG